MGTATRDIVTIVQRAIAQSEMRMDGKPEDIPEDVWEAAHEVSSVVFDASVDLYEIGSSGADPQVVIARAILAERERCYGIAFMHGAKTSDPHEGYAGHSIAAAIRK